MVSLKAQASSEKEDARKLNPKLDEDLTHDVENDPAEPTSKLPLRKLVVSDVCLDRLLSRPINPSAFRSALPELPASDPCGGDGRFGFSGKKSIAFGDEVLEFDLSSDEDALRRLAARSPSAAAESTGPDGGI